MDVFLIKSFFVAATFSTCNAFVPIQMIKDSKQKTNLNRLEPHLINRMKSRYLQQSLNLSPQKVDVISGPLFVNQQKTEANFQHRNQNIKDKKQNNHALTQDSIIHYLKEQEATYYKSHPKNTKGQEQHVNNEAKDLHHSAQILIEYTENPIQNWDDPTENQNDAVQSTESLNGNLNHHQRNATKHHDGSIINWDDPAPNPYSAKETRDKPAQINRVQKSGKLAHNSTIQTTENKMRDPDISSENKDYLAQNPESPARNWENSAEIQDYSEKNRDSPTQKRDLQPKKLRGLSHNRDHPLRNRNNLYQNSDSLVQNLYNLAEQPDYSAQNLNSQDIINQTLFEEISKTQDQNQNKLKKNGKDISDLNYRKSFSNFKKIEIIPDNEYYHRTKIFKEPQYSYDQSLNPEMESIVQSVQKAIDIGNLAMRAHQEYRLLKGVDPVAGVGKMALPSFAIDTAQEVNANPPIINFQTANEPALKLDFSGAIATFLNTALLSSASHSQMAPQQET